MKYVPHCQTARITKVPFLNSLEKAGLRLAAPNRSFVRISTFIILIHM